MNVKNNNKGFSLVELMVVVAIIGILAAVAIPQFSKFQARSRQSEAKGNLSAVYTSEKSFQAEWAQYSSDWFDIGFAVNSRNLRYDVNMAACGGYSVAAGAPPQANGAASTMSGPAGVALPAAAFAFGAALPVVAGPACANGVAPQTFTALSYGNPNSNMNPTTTDQWSITQDKVITNVANGIL